MMEQQGEQIMFTAPTSSNQRAENSEPQLKGFVLKNLVINRLGVVTIIIGFILFVCGACSLALFRNFLNNASGSGVWGGVMIMISGAFAIISSTQPRNKTLNAVNLIGCSIVTLICSVVIILTALNLEYYDRCYALDDTSRNPRGIKIYCETKNKKTGGIAMFSIMVFCVCVQLPISIIMMYFCCRAFESCRTVTCLDDCCSDGKKSNNCENVVYNPSHTVIVQSPNA